MTSKALAEDPQPALYWPQLDGLRTLGFLMVFGFHVGPVPMPSATPSWLAHCFALLGYLQGWCWSGVDLFFVLSAFLITSLLLRERELYGSISFKRYFVRRMLRIWPLYYFYTLLAMIVLPAVGAPGAALGPGQDRYWLPFLLFMGNFQVALAPAGSVCPQMMAHMWSVCIEEQFYIGWCVILLRVARTRTLLACLLTVQASTLVVRAYLVTRFSDSYLTFYTFTLSHLDPLVVGALIAVLTSRGILRWEALRRLGGWLCLAALAFFLVTVASFWNIFWPSWGTVPAMAMMALSFGCLLLGVLSWAPAQRLFSQRWMLRLGRLTYGLYVFHPLGIFTAEAWARKVCQPGGPEWWCLRAGGGLALTLGLASISWTGLEKRFHGLRGRFVRVPSGFRA